MSPNFTGRPQDLVAGATGLAALIAAAPAVAAGIAIGAAGVGLGYLIHKAKKEEEEKKK